MALLNVFCCICCYFPFKVIYILLSLKLLSTIFTFIRISFIFVKNLQCQNPWTIGIPRFSCNTLIMVVHLSMHRIFSLHKLHQFKNAKLLFSKFLLPEVFIWSIFHLLDLFKNRMSSTNKTRIIKRNHTWWFYDCLIKTTFTWIIPSNLTGCRKRQRVARSCL